MTLQSVVISYEELYYCDFSQTNIDQTFIKCLDCFILR